MLDINVEDSGVGIPKDCLHQLFTPFTKIRQNRNFNKDGVGLGLAVSKNIAVALGGDLKVQSEEGQGSCFTLSLPLLQMERFSHERVSSEIRSNLL
jgi:signal transduction histidine kinase